MSNTPDHEFHHGYGDKDYAHAKQHENRDWTKAEDQDLRKEEYEKRLNVFKEKVGLQTVDKLQHVGETYTFEAGDTLYPALKDFFGMNEHSAFLVMTKMLARGINVDLIEPGDKITLNTEGAEANKTYGMLKIEREGQTDEVIEEVLKASYPTTTGGSAGATGSAEEGTTSGDTSGDGTTADDDTEETTGGGAETADHGHAERGSEHTADTELEKAARAEAKTRGLVFKTKAEAVKAGEISADDLPEILRNGFRWVDAFAGFNWATEPEQKETKKRLNDKEYKKLVAQYKEKRKAGENKYTAAELDDGLYYVIYDQFNDPNIEYGGEGADRLQTREEFRRHALSIIERRGENLNPIVKARLLLDLAQQRMRSNYPDTRPENQAKDYSAAMAIDYADQAIAILETEGIQEKMPKTFKEGSYASGSGIKGMLYYAYYIKAHALAARNNTDAIKEYEKAIEIFLASQNTTEKLDPYYYGQHAFAEYARYLIRKDDYDKLEKLGTQVKANSNKLPYGVKQDFVVIADELIKAGKTKEARSIMPTDTRDIQVSRDLETREWKETLTPEQRREKLAAFFQKSESIDLYQKYFAAQYKKLTETGEATPWDYAPSDDNNYIKAYWLTIEASLYREGEIAKDFLVPALDLIEQAGYPIFKTKYRVRDEILKALPIAVSRQLVAETNFLSGAERGEKIDFGDVKKESNGYQYVEIDSDYVWFDAKHGIAVEKYARSNNYLGKKKIDETGRVIQMRANWKQNLEISVDGKNWFGAYDTSGSNHFLFYNPFTREVLHEMPSLTIYQQMGRSIRGKKELDNWDVFIHDTAIVLNPKNDTKNRWQINFTDGKFHYFKQGGTNIYISGKFDDWESCRKHLLRY